MDGTVNASQFTWFGCNEPSTKVADAANAAELDYIPNCILWANTTQYCFDLVRGHCYLEGIFVRQHPSYSVTTAGGHFKIGGGTTRYGWFDKIFNCTSAFAYNGFALIAGTAGYLAFPNISWCRSYNCKFASYFIDAITWSGDINMSDCEAGASAYGIYVARCDTSKFNNIAVNFCDVAIWLRGNTGTISQLNFNNIKAEGNTTLLIAGGSTYGVSRCSIANIEVLTHGTVAATLNSNVTGFAITNPTFVNVNYVDNGTHNKIVGGMSQAETLAGSGTAITINGADAIISGHTVNNYQTGLNLAGASTYALVSGVNLRGNTTAMTNTGSINKGRGMQGAADFG
jgi:hypothetical protein